MNIKDLLRKIFPFFQKAYDWLDKLDYDPNTKKLIKEIWDELKPEVKSAIIAFITAIFAQYGPEKAKEMLNSIIENVSPFKMT